MKRHGDGQVLPERKTHEGGWRCTVETGHGSRRHQAADYILRIANLRSGLSDCLDGGQMEMAPISPTCPSLMSGNKTDHDARKCPMNTKFVVGVQMWCGSGRGGNCREVERRGLDRIGEL